MTQRTNDPSVVYGAWKRTLLKSGSFVNNDGRFPDGTLVWTPSFDGPGDDADYTAGRVPPGLCSPEWGWYQGQILGQLDTNWWFIFLNHTGLPFLCHRHITELRPVVKSN